ncbi:MAG: RHS repeat-associated core domain-containing protein [bacterium]
MVINDDDQLTRYGATTYQYNDAGQLARKDAGSQATQYTYGVMGELEQVVLPDGRTVTYQYDALKRRIGRKINGTTTHRFLWADRLNPVAEVDANGVTTTAYVYGTGINVPDYMVRGGVTYMFVRDHLGSVRFVVDSANGSVVQELRYDAFGQVLLDTNPGFQPFGFAGGLYDSDTGLTRFGVRDYDAQTGRWTARDPIAFGGGQANLYAYTGNDAVNFVDPSGKNPWLVAAGGALLNGSLNGFSVWTGGGDFGKGFVAGAATGWMIALPLHPAIVGGLIGFGTSILNEVWASPSDSPVSKSSIGVDVFRGRGSILGPPETKLGFVDEMVGAPLMKMTNEMIGAIAGIWANLAPDSSI